MPVPKARIAAFIKDWRSVRGKTYEFMETVPDEMMAWRPHEQLLGTFGMQLRHMWVSQRAYVIGMGKGKIDFTDKSHDKALETDKAKVVAGLKSLDMELVIMLDSGEYKDQIEFADGVYGTREVDPETVLNWLMQHETYHQGILTCYGRLAGLGKFRMM
jgi:uncharacterized damage-inducible protein DinB